MPAVAEEILVHEHWIQKLHNFCDTPPPQMMTKNWAESTW